MKSIPCFVVRRKIAGNEKVDKEMKQNGNIRTNNS